MLGVVVESSVPPAEVAAGLPPRRLRPSRVSAKRSWPPGCGRFPAPPPALMSATAVGPREKGTDGASTFLNDRDEEAAPAVILHSVQNDCSNKEEKVVVPFTVSPMPRQQGSDNVEEVAIVQKKENGIAGHKTKWALESSLNPPPKKRTVSAVRKFPRGCGRTVVTTKSSDVFKGSNIPTFPPSCGKSPISTTCSGDEGLPSEVTPVNNGVALVASLALGESASPTLVLEGSSNKLESKRIVDDGHSKAHNRVKVWDDFAGTKQDGDQRNVVPKATPRNASDGNMKGKLSAHKGKHLAQEVVDDKVKNKLDGSLQRSNVRTPLSNPIYANTEVKRLDSGKMNAGLLGNAESVAGGKMQTETLSARKEVVCSNMNTKQKKFACKLKGDDIVKDNLHLSTRKPNLGKHGATNQIEEPSQIIVQALRAPDNCPWTQGRKYIARSSKSLVPRNKLKGMDAKDQGSKRH